MPCFNCGEVAVLQFGELCLSCRNNLGRTIRRPVYHVTTKTTAMMLFLIWLAMLGILVTGVWLAAVLTKN